MPELAPQGDADTSARHTLVPSPLAPAEPARVEVAATVREALAVLSRLDVARDRRRGEAPPHRAPQGGRVVTP